MSESEVYLDYNASAPLDPRVAEAMAQMLAQTGNASSAHRFGRRQSAAADEAREHGADRIVMGSRARWERPGSARLERVVPWPLAWI